MAPLTLKCRVPFSAELELCRLVSSSFPWLTVSTSDSRWAVVRPRNFEHEAHDEPHELRCLLLRVSDMRQDFFEAAFVFRVMHETFDKGQVQSWQQVELLINECFVLREVCRGVDLSVEDKTDLVLRERPYMRFVAPDCHVVFTEDENCPLSEQNRYQFCHACRALASGHFSSANGLEKVATIKSEPFEERLVEQPSFVEAANTEVQIEHEDLPLVKMEIGLDASNAFENGNDCFKDDVNDINGRGRRARRPVERFVPEKCLTTLSESFQPKKPKVSKKKKAKDGKKSKKVGKKVKSEKEEERPDLVYYKKLVGKKSSIRNPLGGGRPRKSAFADPPKDLGLLSSRERRMSKLSIDSILALTHEKNCDYGKLTCKLCSQACLSISAMYGHLRRFHAFYLYRCPSRHIEECKFKCYQPRDLEEHVRAQHSDVTNICCPSCSEVFPLDQFTPHVERCHDSRMASKRESKRGTYACKIDNCDRVFSFPAGLRNHIRMVHVAPSAFKCDVCPYTSNSDAGLIKHKRHHHPSPEEQGPFVCQTCGKIFKTKVALEDHDIRIHKYKYKTYVCDICQLPVIGDRQFLKHRNIHEKKYHCEVCDRSFGSKSELVSHQTAHEEAKFTCEICGKQVKKREQLVDHLRIHTGEKPFSCELCDYSCMSRNTLGLHYKFKHREFRDNRKVERERDQPKRINELLVSCMNADDQGVSNVAMDDLPKVVTDVLDKFGYADKASNKCNTNEAMNASQSSNFFSAFMDNYNLPNGNGDAHQPPVQNISHFEEL